MFYFCRRKLRTMINTSSKPVTQDDNNNNKNLYFILENMKTFILEWLMYLNCTEYLSIISKCNDKKKYYNKQYKLITYVGLHNPDSSRSKKNPVVFKSRYLKILKNVSDPTNKKFQSATLDNLPTTVIFYYNILNLCPFCLNLCIPTMPTFSMESF